MKLNFCFVLFLGTIFMVEPMPRTKRDVDENGQVIRCQPQTPCAWIIYIPLYSHYPHSNGYRESHLKNDYCICPVGTKCMFYRNNDMTLVDEYRCQNADNKYSNYGARY